jgi:Na+-driven multidrug efflux pump
MNEMSRAAAPSNLPPARRVPAGVLAGPIMPTMLRLALPTIAVLVVQTGVGVAETYFVSGLGTAALAGVTSANPKALIYVGFRRSHGRWEEAIRHTWEI